MFPELLTDLISDMWDKLGDDEISQMLEAVGRKTAKDIVLERFKTQKGISFFDKRPFVSKWIKKAHTDEIRKLSMRAVDEQLKKFGVRPGMRKRAQFDLKAQSNVEWWKKQETTHPYAWRYLMDRKHSDRCIYRMRVVYRSTKQGTSNIQIVFAHERYDSYDVEYRSAIDKQGNEVIETMWCPSIDANKIIKYSKPYNYYHIPNAIITVMCMIPLTYLTKNNYFAGAWNFFWYSWLMKNAPTSYLKQMRFMATKAKKGIIKYMSKINKGEA